MDRAPETVNPLRATFGYFSGVLLRKHVIGTATFGSVKIDVTRVELYVCEAHHCPFLPLLAREGSLYTVTALANGTVDCIRYRCFKYIPGVGMFDWSFKGHRETTYWVPPRDELL